MVRDHLQKAEHYNSLLVRAVEDLPVSGMYFILHKIDHNLLINFQDVKGACHHIQRLNFGMQFLCLRSWNA